MIRVVVASLILTNEKEKQDCRSRLELYEQGKPYRSEP
jgi:hypothetical protein